MNNIELIEYIIVFLILSIQTNVFYKTYSQLLIFQSTIPIDSSLKVSNFFIPIDDIKKLTQNEILLAIEQYKNLDSSPENNRHIGLVECSVAANSYFRKIIFSVNNYLIKNQGSASDFILIKDIVQRNLDSIEEGINFTIAIPLYLGLMGTMIGVVIGLFNIPDLNAVVNIKANDIALNQGISSLIGGVKIAMISSFMGLLFTIINSGWIYKKAKNVVSSRLDDFYTLLQIELLPIVDQGLTSILSLFQMNMMRFNEEFSSNLNRLSCIFDSNVKAITAQKELLDAIDKSKVSEMTKFNLKVLQQLDVSVAQFEKFNGFFCDINQFVNNSQLIVSKTNELLERTDNFKCIADNIEIKINQSQELLNFLSEHFVILENHKNLAVNAVADVGYYISESFKELKDHIVCSSDAVRRFTIEELDELKRTLSQDKTNLSNLEHLSFLYADLKDFKNSSALQGETIKIQLNELNQNIIKLISVFENSVGNSLSDKSGSISEKIMTWFGKQKNPYEIN